MCQIINEKRFVVGKRKEREGMGNRPRFQGKSSPQNEVSPRSRE